MVLVLLVLMQVNWLQKLVVLQKEETHQKLQKLIPSIALDINKIDHNLFHGKNLRPSQWSMQLIEYRIDSILNYNGIKSPFCFAIYQDTIQGIFKSNEPAYREKLTQSDIKSCISHIVSVAFAKNQERLPDESEDVYMDRLIVESSFQYFSHVDRKREPSGKDLWVSIYLPNEISTALRSLIYQFVLCVLLLILLLYLLYFLIRSLSQYKKLSEVKDDFFNNMSHEFKIPLSSISLASKVLRQSHDRVKNETYHQLIEKESKHLEIQIDKLLELSLFDREGLQVDSKPVNLHKLIQDIPQRLRLLTEEKSASLFLDLQLENCMLMGDRDHLSNSLCNLVENSLKYADNGVKIWISTFTKHKRTIISVQDDGPGIEPQYQKHIFDRFFRAKKCNQYKTQGFGIGLTYVKTVIEAHKGSISLNTKQLTGCEFIIKL